MTGGVWNILRLGVKELYSLRYDPVFMFLIVYAFSAAIYLVSTGARMEVHNASVAVVDGDRSPLSQRLRDAILPPAFKPPEVIAFDQVDAAQDKGRYTFVLDIPPGFQADVLAGRRARLQLNVDATAMSQAGNGAGQLRSIITQELRAFLRDEAGVPALPVDLVIRAEFNPNLRSGWFMGVMQLINSITLLSIVLCGAALIREREHGTIEHLLAMPIRPIEIMLAKIWANGLVVTVAAGLSLWLVVRGLLAIPVAGSMPLFFLGTVTYLFSITSLGIFLATMARTMPQFGLLSIPVFVIMNLLSGGTTPLDSMPVALQRIMQFVPSTHFVSFSQSVLYRGAGIDIVWPSLVAMLALGAVFFAVALRRFRKTVTLAQV